MPLKGKKSSKGANYVTAEQRLIERMPKPDGNVVGHRNQLFGS
jgi:hypothetical protein